MQLIFLNYIYIYIITENAFINVIGNSLFLINKMHWMNNREINQYLVWLPSGQHQFYLHLDTILGDTQLVGCSWKTDQISIVIISNFDSSRALTFFWTPVTVFYCRFISSIIRIFYIFHLFFYFAFCNNPYLNIMIIYIVENIRSLQHFLKRQTTFCQTTKML